MNDFKTGHVYRYWGSDSHLPGWILADGRYIGKRTPETKALYFLIWAIKESQASRSYLPGHVRDKGATAEADYEADRALKLPNPMRGGKQNYKLFIKL